MNIGRYCFGYCVIEDGRLIVVVGGAQDVQVHLSETEFYDTVKDRWIALPKLN